MTSQNAGTITEKTRDSFGRKLVLTLSMVKITHAVFALPFALISTLYASAGHPTFWQGVLISVAMITARNTAMTFNRIADARMDALNPRTALREIPRGLLSHRFAWIFLVINALLFMGCAALFNRLTLVLAPVALVLVMFYSLTKRLTDATQFFLGIALGSAPIAAWIAITGSIAWFPCLVGLGVMLWTAGFDLIYSTQDHDFDKQHGVHSLVVRLGIAGGLQLARILHALAVIILASASLAHPFPGFAYLLGISIMGVILIGEHCLIRADDLRFVNHAFFTFNGFISVLMLLFAIWDIYP